MYLEKVAHLLTSSFLVYALQVVQSQRNLSQSAPKSHNFPSYDLSIRPPLLYQTDFNQNTKISNQTCKHPVDQKEMHL